MAILALAATIVIVNAPPARSAPRDAAGEFAQMLRGAVDDAIITGRVLRLEIEPAGWRLVRFADGAWVNDAASDEDKLRGTLISVDLNDPAQSNLQALTGEREARTDRDAPVIIPIDPFGGAMEFEIVFQEGRDRWAVRQNANGVIEMVRP